MSATRKIPGLIKLTGTIANYKATRISANFVFTDSDRTAMGVVAVAAALGGLSGPAIAMASNSSSMEEDADYLEFDLDGKPIKGWVWRSPFEEGDVVEIAAEWREDHYEVAGVARPRDRIIALYPHCSRGRSRHVKNAAKWWLIGCTLLFAFMLIGKLLLFPWSGIFANEEGQAYIDLALYAFFGLMTFSLASKWMPFVRLAEKVFTTLGLPDPGNIDLVKSSKAQRKPDDPGEFGTFYFRY